LGERFGQRVRCLERDTFCGVKLLVCVGIDEFSDPKLWKLCGEGEEVNHRAAIGITTQHTTQKNEWKRGFDNFGKLSIEEVLSKP
jgi:hypothetical protein